MLNVECAPCKRDYLGCKAYRAFSHDVTAAMLVFQNKGMAAMMVYQANPLGFELYLYANTLFVSVIQYGCWSRE